MEVCDQGAQGSLYTQRSEKPAGQGLKICVCLCVLVLRMQTKTGCCFITFSAHSIVSAWKILLSDSETKTKNFSCLTYVHSNAILTTWQYIKDCIRLPPANKTDSLIKLYHRERKVFTKQSRITQEN